MRVIERIEGRYETQEMPFSKIYTWRPGHVMVERDCGEVLALISTTAVFRCGMDLTATLRETLAAKLPRDKDLHPWHYAEDREDARCLAERAFDEID